VEVSSGFVWADVDAAGQGTGLSAMLGVDVIASSVLTANVTDAVERADSVFTSCFDASADSSFPGAGGGGLSAAGFEGWNDTENSVTDGSGGWETIFGDRDNIITTSANVITNTGDITNIDGRVTTVEGETPSAAGFVNWNTAYSTDLFPSANVGLGPSAAGYVNWNNAYNNDLFPSANVGLGPSAAGFVNWNTAYNNDLFPSANVGLGPSANVGLGPSAAGYVNWNNAYNNDLFPSAAGFVNWNTAYSTDLFPSAAGFVNWNTAYSTDLFPSAAGFADWNATIGSFTGSATASAMYVGYPAGSAIDLSGTNPGDTVIDVVGNNYILSIDEAAGRAKWVSPPLVTGDGDLQTINPGEGSENATFSLGAATLLIRDVVVGTSLSSGPDSNVTFDRSVTASSCTILSSLSGSPECDVVFSNDVSIENYNESPPSTPIALILKTIDTEPASPTNIGEIRFAGNNSTPANKVYNRLRGISDVVTAGAEDGSIELRHLTAGSEVVSLTANGTGVTVEESLTVSTCPVPAPVCYAQMDGDGTAAASETKFGAGVTPSTETDSTGHITWDNTNKEFDISVAGTYHVLATLNMYVAATTLPTIRIKNGATTKNSYVAHGVHAAERPEEITVQAAFTCAASDTITVTFQDDAATDINLNAGSSVIVRRLF